MIVLNGSDIEWWNNLNNEGKRGNLNWKES